MARPRLLHISIDGEDPALDAARFAHLAETGYDGVWFRNRLAELGLLARLDYVSVDVARGAPLPRSESADVVFLGGSYPSINDGLDWQRRAMDWLADYRARGRPLFAACGGHQMISHLRAGRVAPHGHGLLLGSYPVHPTERGRAHFIFAGFDAAPRFHFGHFEHVVEIPDDTVVLATTEWYEAGALDHGGGWITVQFHPEATREVMMADVIEAEPEVVERFVDLPDAPRMLANFLRGTGIVD